MANKEQQEIKLARSMGSLVNNIRAIGSMTVPKAEQQEMIADAIRNYAADIQALESGAIGLSNSASVAISSTVALSEALKNLKPEIIAKLRLGRQEADWPELTEELDGRLNNDWWTKPSDERLEAVKRELNGEDYCGEFNCRDCKVIDNWRIKGGAIVRVRDMENAHVLNSIAFLRKESPDAMLLGNRIYRALIAQALARGLAVIDYRG